MKHYILLQFKFFLVQFLSISYNLFPNPIRKLYLCCFGIKIGKCSSIHRNCKFFHIGNFSMGNNSVVNFGCYLDNRRGITIGNNVAIAHDTKIYTLGHDISSPRFETKGSPVVIKDNVFVFSNVLIMPGVTIGNGAIILPGSVVVKDVPDFAIVGGNPAKFVRNREAGIDYLNKYNYWFAL